MAIFMFFSFFLLLVEHFGQLERQMEALLSWEWKYMGIFKVVCELRFLLLHHVHSVLNEIYDHKKS